MQRWTTILTILMMTAASYAGAAAFDPGAAKRISSSDLTQIRRDVLLKGRIKDIVDIKGIRDNPLQGFGLVIGLRGTGDDSPLSRRALASLIRQHKISIPLEDIKSKSIASVMVTAKLPPFARRGSTIDVEVAVIGNASSLQGGTLLRTPLYGADGEPYALAQGPISIGGFAAEGEAASIVKGHPVVGRISNGAHIEREELSEFVENGEVTLQLRNPDFTTCDRIAKAINSKYKQIARAVDPGTVRVDVPAGLNKAQVPAFISEMGSLRVEMDMPAIVVVNERTGTIIVGENVRISTVAISHGNLSIITKETENVSQPSPLSRTGSTEKTKDTKISATEKASILHVIPQPVSVQELANALNAMGLTPRDLIAIFEALKRAGALQAELKFM